MTLVIVAVGIVLTPMIAYGLARERRKTQDAANFSRSETASSG